jgi:Protein of unknown function (DUF4238)
MSAQHYVSNFHLREFCDLASIGTPDPWVWVCSLSDSSVKRRSPKNIGTAPDLFEGPGGLAQPEATIENFLANEVEGPASRALRKLCSQPSSEQHELPPELMRYLGWAASRSLPMQRLEIQWRIRFGALLISPPVEPPPKSLIGVADRARTVRQSNFLEGIHIQAHYFQARWFPRLRWFTLRPPAGDFFIIGDRPVGCGARQIVSMLHRVACGTQRHSSLPHSLEVSR